MHCGDHHCGQWGLTPAEISCFRILHAENGSQGRHCLWLLPHWLSVGSGRVNCPALADCACAQASPRSLCGLGEAPAAEVESAWNLTEIRGEVESV